MQSMVIVGCCDLYKYGLIFIDGKEINIAQVVENMKPERKQIIEHCEKMCKSNSNCR